NPSEGVVSQASGEQVGEMFRYELDAPVTLDRRKSAMLPIINNAVDVDKVSIYTADVHTTHPMHALRLTNLPDMHLTAGPITVFEDAVYAGDARITHVGPGEKRLISYALDQEVTVTRDEAMSSPVKITSASIKDGILSIQRMQQTTEAYHVANRDTAPCDLIIEHPQPSAEWKVVRPEEPAEKAGTYLRFELTVPGERSQILEVVQQREWMETCVMADLPIAAVRLYLEDPGVPGPVKQTLSRLAELLDELHRLQLHLTEQTAQTRSIEQEQTRIKANMTDLDRTNDLYQRYLKMLETTEDELAKVREMVDTTRQEMEQTQGRIEQVAPRHAAEPFPVDNAPAANGTGDPFEKP
ncbi:MAG: hypothetical protein JJ992_12855, partial [Planctomycetes bacterium]|nr:hypothetical protein [Planctomycetota bacterium]